MPDIEPEADRAERHKREIGLALGAVVDAMEAARRDGFMVEVGAINLNGFGRYVLSTPVALIKRF